MRVVTLARRDSLPSPSDSVESHQPERPKGPLRPVLACDGHALLWLTCCCWASRPPTPRSGRLPSKPPGAMRSVRSLRLRHTTPDPITPSSEKARSPPSAAPACQGAELHFRARRAYRTFALRVKSHQWWVHRLGCRAVASPRGHVGMSLYEPPSLPPTEQYVKWKSHTTGDAQLAAPLPGSWARSQWYHRV